MSDDGDRGIDDGNDSSRETANVDDGRETANVDDGRETANVDDGAHEVADVDDASREMADGDDNGRGVGGGDDDDTGDFDEYTLPERLTGGSRLAGHVLPAVLVVTVLASVVRLVDLGGRVFHWDEGRVGYWILRFDQTGEFFYRPIIHGPFLPVVNNAVFDVLPPSDFAARLPVALVGGLLPLTVLLLRDRLSNRETLAVALVLAVDPVLLYYSRFMRSDVLVAAFSFTAFALAIAAIDRRNGLYAVPAAAAMALAFTAKENALVYVLCLAGAAVLMIDHRLVAVASRTGSLLDAVVDAGLTALRALDDWTAEKRVRTAAERRLEPHTSGAGRDRAAAAVHLGVWVPVVTLLTAGTFLTVVTFFYAPRPDLWQALGGTRPLAPVIEAGTVGAAEKFVDHWVSGGGGNPYLAFVWDLLQTLVYGSGVVVILGVIGFFADGYAGKNRRLVAFTSYWAAVSLLGYPVGTDIQAPWLAVHVVVPLAVPAGVGLVHVIDSFETSLTAEDGVRLGVTGLVLLAAAGGVVVPNADYWNAADREDEEILQWAQPENDVQETLQTVEAVARHNEGTDVLYVGTETPRGERTRLWVGNESALDSAPPTAYWHSRLPLPWYTERANATVTSTAPSARFDGLPDDPPPVVVAYDWDRGNLSRQLPGYTAHEHDFKLWGEEIVVFLDRSAVSAAQSDTVGHEPSNPRSTEPREMRWNPE